MSSAIDHFTVACLVAWPLKDRKAGGDLVLIQTSLVLSCKCTAVHSYQIAEHYDISKFCLLPKRILRAF